MRSALVQCLLLVFGIGCGDGATLVDDGGALPDGSIRATPDGGGTTLLDPQLVQVEDFAFAGAFRLPADDYGESELNFSEGPIALNADGTSMFIVGHAHQQAIAEFPIPQLVQSETVSDLNMAGAPAQPFAQVLDRVSGGNTQSISRIYGMHHIEGSLLVNAYEYYDAPADNSHTTLVIRDASDLAGSTVDGYFSLWGGAHAGGWLSEVPAEWRDALGGPMITGASSGRPIIGRWSVGPTAFAFNSAAVVAGASVPEPIPTEILLDYSLENRLHEDLSNDGGENDLWTHLSRAVFGFVVPGTRTYATLGHTGGHGPDGVCYKCGDSCGGYCPVDRSDEALYYWFYDLDDLVAVRAGSKAPHTVQPYAYGVFPAPFSTNEMGGGAYDADKGLLYLTMLGADREQGTYANPPIVVAFRIAVP